MHLPIQRVSGSSIRWDLSQQKSQRRPSHRKKFSRPESWGFVPPIRSTGFARISPACAVHPSQSDGVSFLPPGARCLSAGIKRIRNGTRAVMDSGLDGLRSSARAFSLPNRISAWRSTRLDSRDRLASRLLPQPSGSQRSLQGTEINRDAILQSRPSESAPTRPHS